MRLFAAGWFLGLCVVGHPVQAQDTAALLAASRATAGKLLQQLGAELRSALADNGPEGAVSVCKTVAPELVGRLSRDTGWRVSRVSLRTRNPLLGTPDGWEQKVLAEFDRRVGAGAKPEELEFGEVVNEPAGRFYRYMKAIPVQPLCLTCHGTVDQIAPFVQEQLKADYPHDRATNYNVGQVRGAVTIKQPL